MGVFFFLGRREGRKISSLALNIGSGFSLGCEREGGREDSMFSFWRFLVRCER